MSPTALDKELRPEVEALLEEFGRPVIVRLVEESFDPQTDMMTHSETDIATKGVVEGYSSKLLSFRSSFAGAERPAVIQAGDLQLLVPGIPFDGNRKPKPNDLVFLGEDDSAEQMTVITSQLVSTGEQDALYVIQVRGNE